MLTTFKNILVKYQNNLYLGIILGFCLTSIDQVYRIYNDHLSWHIYKNILMTLLLCLTLTLLRKTKWAIFLYLSIVCLIFIQLVHFSYFGTRISPIDISLFFHNGSQVMESFKTILQITWAPLFICIFAAFIALLAFKFLKKRQSCRYAGPIKHKLPNINIIFIQGESLTKKHMSCYGYPRNTTPFLNSLLQQNNVIFKLGISSGVCTDVSIPLFFNMIRRPDGEKQIASTNRNLFKMAEANGFTTYFISSHKLRYIGLVQNYLFPIYIKNYLILGSSLQHPKQKLLNALLQVNLNQPTFMVLQLMGSHAPYEQRYPTSYNHFTSKQSNPSFKKLQTNLYDNSVLYTDSVIKQIVDDIKHKTQRPTYIIFTSDHGESLGGGGIYGHYNLKIKQQHEVPIIIMAINGADLHVLQQKDKEDINNQYMSHYELSILIAHLLGFETKQLSTQHSGYYITGSIISGFGGYNHMTFDQAGIPQDHLRNFLL